VAVAVFNSTLFNGWRHLYFVYPGFVALALAGLVYLWRRCRAAASARRRQLGQVALAGAVAASLAITTSFMVRSHPHQIVYFNLFAGGLEKARDNFQVGYWGPEYREALEYLIENVVDDQGKFYIYLSESPSTLQPVVFNLQALPTKQRDRFSLTHRERAGFFMTNYNSQIPVFDFEELWSREVDGVKILSLYRIR
jgi:hypothetical protein